MKILLNTNIVLDLLLAREPHVHAAKLLFSKIEATAIMGFICATSVTTLDYLIKKTQSRTQANDSIRKLMKLLEIAPVNRTVLEDALESQFSDFEDATIHAAAVHCGAQAIVTRNGKDFQKAQLPIYSPEDLLNIFVTPS